jgi:hypothetical protein
MANQNQGVKGIAGDLQKMQQSGQMSKGFSGSPFTFSNPLWAPW